MSKRACFAHLPARTWARDHVRIRCRAVQNVRVFLALVIAFKAFSRSPKQLAMSQPDASPFVPTLPAHASARLEPHAPHAGGIRYQPGLDGLRALCVTAILLYHADLPWLSGGFLGVEVFFVVSGFLITSLLRAEVFATGGVDLVGFWWRRARRLLPALWATLLVVSLYAVCFLPEELFRLRGEVLAGLTYVSNWYLAWGNQSYFEQVGRPSPLRHLWSLAIEEQFYLVFPVLYGLAARKLTPRGLGLSALGLASVSALAMAFAFVPGEDPSALYYHSGMRASGMLLGAALACLWQPASQPAHADPAARLESAFATGASVTGIGALGLLGLGLACVCLSEADALVFRYGLFLVDLCALAVIFAVVHPSSNLIKRALSQRTLRYLGTRSYGLYLWHWPLFVVTRPGLDLSFEGPLALVLRLLGALLLAEISYRWVEQPVRSGRAFAWFRAQRARPGFAWPGVAAALSVTLVCLGVTHGLVRAVPPQEPAWELTAQPGHGGELALTGQVPPSSLPGTLLAADARTGASVSEPAPARASRVMIFGDSVVLGAKNSLRAGYEDEVEIDSEIGRTSSTALPRLRKLKRTKKLRPVMIVHLGNNGWVYEEQVHEMMALFDEVERVVFVTARVAKRWQDRNNAVLERALSQHPRAVLVDWCKASEGHREWLGADGLHLTPTGAKAFADLLSPYYR